MESNEFFLVERQLSGMDWWIWLLFADREYHPNSLSTSISLATGLSYVVFTLAITFYVIWPCEWFSVFYVFLAALIVIFNTIESANQHVLESGFLLIAGGSLAVANVQWGFAINGHPFESGLYHLLFSGGIAAILRRIWNACVWHELNRIQHSVLEMK